MLGMLAAELGAANRPQATDRTRQRGLILQLGLIR